jgi:hypothetical protein
VGAGSQTELVDHTVFTTVAIVIDTIVITIATIATIIIATIVIAITTNFTEGERFNGLVSIL